MHARQCPQRDTSGRRCRSAGCRRAWLVGAGCLRWRLRAPHTRGKCSRTNALIRRLVGLTAAGLRQLPFNQRPRGSLGDVDPLHAQVHAALGVVRYNPGPLHRGEPRSSVWVGVHVAGVDALHERDGRLPGHRPAPRKPPGTTPLPRRCLPCRWPARHRDARGTRRLRLQSHGAAADGWHRYTDITAG